MGKAVPRLWEFPFVSRPEILILSFLRLFFHPSLFFFLFRIADEYGRLWSFRARGERKPPVHLKLREGKWKGWKGTLYQKARKLGRARERKRTSFYQSFRNKVSGCPRQRSLLDPSITLTHRPFDKLFYNNFILPESSLFCFSLNYKI